MKLFAALGCLFLLGAVPPTAPRGHPPGFYDIKPQPGPFVIFFEPGEAVVSDGARPILDNALKYWPAPERGRFVLCYDAAAEGKDGQVLEADRKKSVRDALIGRGAVQVLDSEWDCFHRKEPLPSDRARMAIIGVLETTETSSQPD